MQFATNLIAILRHRLQRAHRWVRVPELETDAKEERIADGNAEDAHDGDGSGVRERGTHGTGEVRAMARRGRSAFAKVQI